MNLQSPKRPTRSAKEKAIDNDLLMLSEAIDSSTSINILGSYQELYDLVVNEELTPGNWYKFPYRSVNFLNGWESADANTGGAFPSYDAREVYVGDEEIILVQAVSSSQIANNAYSENYPGDVIQFTPYTNQIGVQMSINNGATLPDSSILSGFDLQWDGTNVYFNMPSGYPALFGHYFYLYAGFNDGVDIYYQQVTYEPLTPGISIPQLPSSTIQSSRLKVIDGGTKILLIDLVEADVTNYIADSLNVTTIYAIDDAYGWITRRTDTQRNISTPFDFRGRKYRRYEVDRFGFIDIISYSSSGSTATDGIYYVSGNNITGFGYNSIFKVTVVSGSVTSVEFENKGRSYAISDTILIDGTSIGGITGDDDITITIEKVITDVNFWSIGTNFNGVDVPSDIYKDFKVFTENENTQNNIQWEGIGSPDMISYSGYSDNNVFFGNVSNVKISDNSYSNTIDTNFESNIIGNNFYENTIGYNFNDNIIGNNFRKNTIGYDVYYNKIGSDIRENIIGNNCQNNTIGNRFRDNVINNFFAYNTIDTNFKDNIIGDSFAYNKIGNYFYKNFIHEGFGFGFNSSQGNVIGNYFSDNKIGEYFYNNIISDSFYYNIIVDYFQLNDIKAFNVYNQDFTSSTYVYGSYNCSIFKRSDGSLVLTYVDNTDTINYQAITD